MVLKDPDLVDAAVAWEVSHGPLRFRLQHDSPIESGALVTWQFLPCLRIHLRELCSLGHKTQASHQGCTRYLSPEPFLPSASFVSLTASLSRSRPEMPNRLIPSTPDAAPVGSPSRHSTTLSSTLAQPEARFVPTLQGAQHPPPTLDSTAVRELTTEVIAVTEHTMVTQQTSSPQVPHAVVMSWTGGAPSAPEGTVTGEAPVTSALFPDELPPR